MTKKWQILSTELPTEIDGQSGKISICITKQDVPVHKL
jgi:hypothetical protein